MARQLTVFQRQYWDPFRIEVLRRRWRTFDPPEEVVARCNRISSETLLAVDAYRCRMMAAWLGIKRPEGFTSVQHIRQQNPGLREGGFRIKAAIVAAKVLAKREKERRRRIAQREKMQQKQKPIKNDAPQQPQRPAWMKPDEPAPKPKVRPGRPFSMMAMRGKDPRERSVLEQRAKAGLGRLMRQVKEG